MDEDGIDGRQLQELAYAYYAKEPEFRYDGAHKDWLKLFGDLSARAENDWRASLNSQKGFGCFATQKELDDLTGFKPEHRLECAHRGAPDGGEESPGNLGCWLSPQSADGTYSPCADLRQGGGQAPKLLRQSGKHRRYSYQRVEPVAEDMDLLTGDGDGGKVPLFPLIAALYGGSPKLNPGHQRKGVQNLYADHHIDPVWAPMLLLTLRLSRRMQSYFA